jgi:ribosomal protein L24
MQRGKKLTETVFEIVSKEWPIHPSNVCRILKIDPNSSNISKIKYHFDILRRDNKINVKKLDRALVAWPSEVERLRVMQELIREN